MISKKAHIYLYTHSSKLTFLYSLYFKCLYLADLILVFVYMCFVRVTFLFLFNNVTFSFLFRMLIFKLIINYKKNNNFEMRE